MYIGNIGNIVCGVVLDEGVHSFEHWGCHGNVGGRYVMKGSRLCKTWGMEGKQESMVTSLEGGGMKEMLSKQGNLYFSTQIDWNKYACEGWAEYDFRNVLCFIGTANLC